MGGGDQSSAQAEYLKASVGPVLSKAFAELAISQPADAVSFLGNWLDTYVEAQRVERAAAVERESLEAQRVSSAAKRKELEAARKERDDEIMRKEKAVQAFRDELENLYQDPFKDAQGAEPLDSFDGQWTRLLNCAQTLTGVTGLYLAKVNTVAEGNETITYMMASKQSDDATAIDHDFLLDKTLKKEAGGVTWKAFEPKVAEEAAEGEPVAEGPKYQYLHVPDVMERDTEIQFYDITRLGSMLIVPMVFPDLVTEDALKAAKAFIEDREKRMAEADEIRKAAEAREAAGEVVEEGVPPEPEPIVPTEDQIPGTGEVKIALVMDTLKMAGRGGDPENVLQNKHVAAIDELCQAMAKCKIRYDRFGVWQQAFAEFSTRGTPEDLALKEKEFRVGQEGVKTGGDEAVAAKEGVGDDANVDELTVVRLEHAFKAYTDLLPQYAEEIEAFKKLPIVPQSTHVLIAAAALFCLLEPTHVLSRDERHAPVWEKCRVALPGLVKKFAEVGPRGPRTGLHKTQHLAYIKELCGQLPPPKEDGAFTPGDSVGLEALAAWLRTGVELRELDVKMRREKNPEEPCDDCVPVAAAEA